MVFSLLYEKEILLISKSGDDDDEDIFTVLDAIPLHPRLPIRHQGREQNL